MSVYPCSWSGSTNAEDESGVAEFMIDGECYKLTLARFSDFQLIEKMLDVAFTQGKRFGFRAVSSHVRQALKNAERAHGL